MSGDESSHVLELIGWLVELVAEVQGRYRRMRELDDVTCPESKVTPQMSRDPVLNMPITAIVVDEVQVPLEDRTSVRVEDKKLTAGEYVGELLTWLAKKGPAAGIVLVLATQRPDSKTIPSGLRAVVGSRFALRVMDWRDSNIVLGEQMNTRGYDSSRLLASHKGVGILRPDGDTQAGADVLALTVRTYYMPNQDWQLICQRGRALREAEGTLTGHAAGQDSRPELDHAAAVKAIGAGTTGSVRSSSLSAGVPEPLASIIDHLDELAGEVSEFVSTADLAEVLDADAAWLGRRLGELGCRSTRERLTSESGQPRQVRGYLTADLMIAAAAIQQGQPPDGQL